MLRYIPGLFLILSLVLVVFQAPALGLADAAPGMASESAPVDAQDAIEVPTDPAPAPETTTPQTPSYEPEGTDDDSSAMDTSTGDTPMGLLLAVLAALVALAMTLLRMPWVDEWLRSKGWKRYKPAMAAVLGAIAATVAVAVTGVTEPALLINAGVAGLVAGLGATGAHQAITGR